MYYNNLLDYKEAIFNEKWLTMPLSTGLLKEIHTLISPHLPVYYTLHTQDFNHFK